MNGDHPPQEEALIASSAKWIAENPTLPMCGSAWRAAFEAGVDFGRGAEAGRICVCPDKPCAFCALPLKERLAQTDCCTGPDIDVPSMFCGHPLPCPRHLKEPNDG